MLERFVCAELAKHATRSDANYGLLHYRDADGFEIDVVIENGAGLLASCAAMAAKPCCEARGCAHCPWPAYGDHGAAQEPGSVGALGCAGSGAQGSRKLTRAPPPSTCSAQMRP